MAHPAHVLALTACAIATARADDTMPIPPESYIRFEPSYTLSQMGNTGEFAFRGLAVSHEERPSAAGIDIATDGEGFTNLELTQLTGVKVGSKLLVGAGITLAPPTSNAMPVRLGPAWFVQTTSFGPIDVSALARTYFALSDVDRGVAIVTRIEPSVSLTLGKWVLSSGDTIDIAWLAGRVHVPANLSLAHDVGAHVVVRAGPVVTVVGPDRGAVKFDLQIDVQP